MTEEQRAVAEWLRDGMDWLKESGTTVDEIIESERANLAQH